MSIDERIIDQSLNSEFNDFEDAAINDYFDNFGYSDWPLNFELSLRGKIDYQDYPSFVYRIHEDSLSRIESKENVAISIEKLRTVTNKIFETRQNEYKLLNQLKDGNEI